MKRAWTKGLKVDFEKSIIGLKKIPLENVEAWISSDGLKIVQLRNTNEMIGSEHIYKWLESTTTYDTAINNAGYKLVGIGSETYLLHRLVAKTYIENSDPKTKKEVNHIDHNKLNNDYKNLEWVTHAENIQKAYKAGAIPENKHYAGRYNIETHTYTDENHLKTHMTLAEYLRLRPDLTKRILKNMTCSDIIDEIFYENEFGSDDATYVFDLLDYVCAEDVIERCQRNFNSTTESLEMLVYDYIDWCNEENRSRVKYDEEYDDNDDE